MEVESILHMNGGNGKTSYANNSLTQAKCINQVRPIVEEAIKDLFETSPIYDSNCIIRVADLGCSSGPNTFLAISQILEAIHGLCRQKGYRSPEFQVYLNDLPGNDFNSIFRSVPDFYERLEEEKGDDFGPCFVTGVPGTFYRQLFPSDSMHFIHSSFGPHWLSRVPKGITNNKGNVYMGKTSPPNVFTAYKEQFKNDFSSFLSLRSKEMVRGGRMVLTIDGRRSEDPTSKDCSILRELLAKSLLDLVAEGSVEEGDVDTFNIPYYNTYKGELEGIIEQEGSFRLGRLEIFDLSWDPANPNFDDNGPVADPYRSGKNAANVERAVFESMLVNHFRIGECTMDRLFKRYAERIAEQLSVERVNYTIFVMSLVKN